ncbi:type I site-specific deoxyribonuclease, HsdR family domain protein [Mycobacterium ulcerans str. Harvey]|uniref:Type I site-specific deoxyribonuclease, HsdR family domain protein n=1 Tax=Mycobacterium ulcerans str. Harvey TaxID=1299332 RepID=A0ABN0RAP8_MYCUL|nr:type I site-specific deoxyribonuclease, HsdR family domain protein [Mycobacterium ulcerans str. Harvey]
MRKVIIDERPTNPKYYDSMSKLLDDIIAEATSRHFSTRPTSPRFSKPLIGLAPKSH